MFSYTLSTLLFFFGSLDKDIFYDLETLGVFYVSVNIHIFNPILDVVYTNK